MISSVVVIVVVVVVVVDTNSAYLNIWASALLVSAMKRLPFVENWLQLLQIHSIPLVFAVFADEVMLFVVHRSTPIVVHIIYTNTFIPVSLFTFSFLYSYILITELYSKYAQQTCYSTTL